MHVVNSNDVYVDIYKNLCAIVMEDPAIHDLSTGVIFDFDLDEVGATPVSPRVAPRIYLLPSSVSYARENSCNNNLQLEYSFVIDGFHFRDERAHKLAWRLMFLLRNIPFTSLKIDDYEFPVICEVGNGSWDYDVEKETIQHSLSISVQVKV